MVKVVVELNLTDEQMLAFERLPGRTYAERMLNAIGSHWATLEQERQDAEGRSLRPISREEK